MNDSINGYPVIATFNIPKAPATREGRVVIVDRGAEYAGRSRYVAASQYATNGVFDPEWASGHYSDSIEQALTDFNEQVERNYYGAFLPGWALFLEGAALDR